ncbi:metal-dependent hydrolase [Erythrobacter sp. Alg231-14]|uniref:metal-dependent hydrolase n=1 Tax=Erythrobacter sp. Alg231-14 TaxID=1922225 RepID=UPI000D55C1C5
MTAHPMDEFPVRKFRFDFDAAEPETAVWSQSSELFSLFANAFTLHVPYFEKYLVRSMIAARGKITDEKLKRDVDAIIGQEAHHADAFIKFNDLLKRRYPKAQAMEEHAKYGFKDRLKKDDFKTLVGFTAGYETFTFLAGMLFLDNYDEWMADSDPKVKALWVWHQVEEVEHAAVAFDVYKHFFADDENFRRRMVLSAFWHIVSETFKAYLHMCKVEGWFSNPIRAARAMGFITRVVSQMIWNARPVMRSGYHPRNHPLATTEQNPIAVSWRRFHKEGGDVLEIDHAKMKAILEG